MRHVAILALAGLVIGCAAQPSGPAAERQSGYPATRVAAAPVCRLSPEGGPILADRGIGGTGAPVAKLTPAVAGLAQVAERGIGGTGIVGVITGFASVCVDGLEVTYDDTVPVEADGTVKPVSALRVGQVVVIKADGSAGAPHAQTISLRQEVSGRVEALEPASGLLTIAGVPVSVTAETWGANRFGPGDWVTVSGLSRADGVIVASRLDVAPPGVFNVHGRIVRDGTAVSVGRLTLPSSMAAGVQDGQPVIVTGVYTEGGKQPVAIHPDRLSADPASYFGSSVDHMVVQAFVRVASDGVWLNGWKVAATPALRSMAAANGLAVVSLEREPDGSLSATEVRAADLRMRGVAAASDLHGFGLGNTTAPVTRRASLTPIRPDAAGVGSPANEQPPAAAASAVPNPAMPPASANALPLSTPPSRSAPARTMPSVPVSTAAPSTNLPLLTTVPPPAAPSGSNPTLAVSPSVLATTPNVGMASPPATPAPAPTIMAPAAVQAPAVPPSEAPQIEGVYAPLISSNGGATATPPAGHARTGPRTVLASQAGHAHSVPGSTSKPSISLVTTVLVPDATATAPTEPGASGTIRPSPGLSPLAAGRGRQH